MEVRCDSKDVGWPLINSLAPQLEYLSLHVVGSGSLPITAPAFPELLKFSLFTTGDPSEGLEAISRRASNLHALQVISRPASNWTGIGRFKLDNVIGGSHITSISLAGPLDAFLPIATRARKPWPLRRIILNPSPGSFHTFCVEYMLSSFDNCNALEQLTIYGPAAISILAAARADDFYNKCLDHVQHFVLSKTRSEGTGWKMVYPLLFTVSFLIFTLFYSADRPRITLISGLLCLP